MTTSWHTGVEGDKLYDSIQYVIEAKTRHTSYTGDCDEPYEKKTNLLEVDSVWFWTARVWLSFDEIHNISFIRFFYRQ